jgi:hypothetical protein
MYVLDTNIFIYLPGILILTAKAREETVKHEENKITP